jgi:hypothetical protein
MPHTFLGTQQILVPRFGGAAAAWTPASPDLDGNLPHTGFAPWLLTGIYQDNGCSTPATTDGHSVGCMTNTEMFGTDVYSVVQATAGNKPTLRTGANGLDNQPVIQGDGGDWLAGAFNGGLLTQPVTIIAVFQQDAATVGDNTTYVLYDSDDGTNRLRFNQDSTFNPDQWAMFAGVALGGANPDANWKILFNRYNGVSSQQYLNGVLDASGFAGNQGIDGLTFFANRLTTSNWVGKSAALFIIDALASDAVLDQYGAYLQSIFPSLSYTDIT